MANTKKVAPSKPKVAVEDDLMEGLDTTAIDDMLEGIELEIPVYKTGEKLEFVHAGGKVKGSVLGNLSEGKVKVVDKAGTIYKVYPADILKDGETAGELIARTKGKKPVYKQTELPLKESKADKQATLGKAKIAKPVIGKSLAQKKVPGKTQRELVEEQAEKGILDYDKIAEKTGVTRANVGQYMYRWKKAKEVAKKSKK